MNILFSRNLLKELKSIAQENYFEVETAKNIDDAIKKTYQIQLKSIEDKLTEVYFTDISEVNDQNTKEFSYILLGNIQKQF